MSITAERKSALIEENGTPGRRAIPGLPKVRLRSSRNASTTSRNIMKTHKHDFHSRRGLLVMVGQRRRLLDYRQEAKNHGALRLGLIQSLGLRR